MAQPLFTRLYTLLCCLMFFRALADPIQVSLPQTPSVRNVVEPNFLGISFELSFMDEYFGNDTSTIPAAMMNYLTAIRSHTGSSPLRIRVGGNSMDSSKYYTNMTSPMVQLTDPDANANNQPVNYGPMLWEVLKKVSADVGGASYLVGLSLLDPDDSDIPTVAGAAQKELSDSLDGFLLGNEPDLYTNHKQRPNLKNYTTNDYINEFRMVSNRLVDTSGGDILDLKNLGGPTVCCFWNLDALLQDGYLAAFSGILKYISLQHYPQNNCFGRHDFDVPYYMQHANVVRLTSWQHPGVSMVSSAQNTSSLKVIMSEFNSASCGGVPTVSDTFAVGSLWTIDYALQMASVGYSAAYLHTRERGISYNLFTPPDGPTGSQGAWVTNPPYYALLTTAEILQSSNGSVVVDMDISKSKSDINATVAGYAIYDAAGADVQRLVLFNYANTSSASFSLPSNTFASVNSRNLTIKYLSAQSATEKTNIAWGGQSLANTGNGIFKDASWAPANKWVDCTNGCSVDVPGPGLAVVSISGLNVAQKINPHSGAGKPAVGTVFVTILFGLLVCQLHRLYI